MDALFYFFNLRRYFKSYEAKASSGNDELVTDAAYIDDAQLRVML